MKRKIFTLLVAGITFLAGFGGVAAFLSTGPASAEMEPAAWTQEIHSEADPILVAGGLIQKTDDPEPDDTGGGITTNGNSWSG